MSHLIRFVAQSSWSCPLFIKRKFGKWGEEKTKEHLQEGNLKLLKTFNQIIVSDKGMDILDSPEFKLEDYHLLILNKIKEDGYAFKASIYREYGAYGVTIMEELKDGLIEYKNSTLLYSISDEGLKFIEHGDTIAQ